MKLDCFANWSVVIDVDLYVGCTGCSVFQRYELALVPKMMYQLDKIVLDYMHELFPPNPFTLR